jgi:GT2 family glycosyltransferase
MTALAIVIIGRNEGERLARCLDSVAGSGAPIVYVDSGSTDGSPALARRRSVLVVELDPSRPFSAARGRNEGLQAALARDPELELVQFVDGDCEVVPGWLERALGELAAHPEAAAVSGYVRERHPERSVYNRIFALDWGRGEGEVAYCGGNAMYRVKPLREAGGFDPGLIAGEESELCLRIRRSGWRIRQVAHDMVLHDIAMTRFSQWWSRAVRTGWAYAEGAARHPGERLHARETASVLAWGAALPAGALALAAITGGAGLVLLAAYPVLWGRVFQAGRRRGFSGADARLHATFTVLGKFPQAWGVVQFALLRAVGRRRRVIDWRVAG